jgi:F420 biosynthesis protein FbiB-like protein
LNLTELIRQRRSIRKFKDRPVPEPLIRNMIEAAVCAPSASNRQPWRFMVVSDPALRRQMAAGVEEAASRMAGEIRPGFEKDYQSYSRHFLLFEQAPVLLLALFRSEATLAALFREDSPAHERMTALEQEGAVISVAMAVQNLLLSAADQGLGACVMTGPLIAVESLERLLSVPDGWKILCMVGVGYPDESPGLIRKKTVEQVVIHPKPGGA